MINVSGNAVEVVGNRMESGTDVLIDSAGDDHLITRNIIRGGRIGIQHIAGENPVVIANRIENVGASFGAGAVVVSCPNECSRARVDRNHIEGAAGQTSGLVVSSRSPGMTVRRNRIRGVGGAGIWIVDSVGITIEGNRADGTGSAHTGCYFVDFGSDHVISRNLARECHGPGISVHGINHIVSENDVQRARHHGIFVWVADRVVVRRNRVRDVNGAGLAITSAATNSMADRNVVTRARNGLCNASPTSTVTNHSSSRVDAPDEFLPATGCGL